MQAYLEGILHPVPVGGNGHLDLMAHIASHWHHRFVPQSLEPGVGVKFCMYTTTKKLMIHQEVKIDIVFEIHENLGAENLESFASVVCQLRTFHLFLAIPLPPVLYA